MRESEEFKKVKAEAAKLRNLHKLNPRMHEWVPMQLMNTSDNETLMELGCKCGMWVWIRAEEVKTFE